MLLRLIDLRERGTFPGIWVPARLQAMLPQLIDIRERGTFPRLEPVRWSASEAIPGREYADGAYA
eukprot:4797086-Heterocapsa_arctica.AAC.1